MPSAATPPGSMEVFGHLGFALTDVDQMFEAELESAACLLGVSTP